MTIWIGHFQSLEDIMIDFAHCDTDGGETSWAPLRDSYFLDALFPASSVLIAWCGSLKGADSLQIRRAEAIFTWGDLKHLYRAHDCKLGRENPLSLSWNCKKTTWGELKKVADEFEVVTNPCYYFGQNTYCRELRALIDQNLSPFAATV